MNCINFLNVYEIDTVVSARIELEAKTYVIKKIFSL